MGNFNIANSAAYEHMAWAGSTSAGPPDHILAVYMARLTQLNFYRNSPIFVEFWDILIFDSAPTTRSWLLVYTTADVHEQQMQAQ